MKILIIHNKYKIEGGEDIAVEMDIKLLNKHNHTVLEYFRDNRNIKSIIDKIKVFARIVYSVDEREKIKHILEKEKPDIVHVHNIFPLVTPSVYDACYEKKVPVVQTLHNYRIVCVNGLFLRNGKVCEECLKGSLLSAVKYRCYKNSVLGSVATARMVSHHKMKQTWNKKVDGFIALTDFSKKKFVEYGLQDNKIYTKSNYIPDDANAFARKEIEDTEMDEVYAIYVGRLSEEKGISVLLDAWKKIQGWKLKIVGDGPLKEYVVKNSKNNDLVEYLGKKSNIEVHKLLLKAKVFILPSICYEGFPIVVLESFSKGVPIISSNLGSLASIIEHKKNGLLFNVMDTNDLVSKIVELFSDKLLYQNMVNNILKNCSKQYSEKGNYNQLMSIYTDVLEKYDYKR